MDFREKMEELVAQLNRAADAYYNGEEVISNFEYDRLYDRLEALEKESGLILPDSPTQRAGFRTVDSLAKVTHEFPALSLDKTKDTFAFRKVFDIRDRRCAVMWKLDGSTVICTYEGGRLVCAATRGNGVVGSDITHNAPRIKGLPTVIDYKGKLVVRGEAVMSYEAFEKVNATLPPEEQYKNPRNLANATISMLSDEELTRREILFHAFKLVYMDSSEEYPFHESFLGDMKILERLGIHTVEYRPAYVGDQPGGDGEELDAVIADFSERAKSYPFPVDGLVVAANDVEFAEAQPGTGHNPHKLVGYALKWQDETAETVLKSIEWQASRTGLINPVAVFEPVELEGTTVTRATLHNISYIVELDLKTGDRITVYKANKIIPKVADNLDKEPGEREIGEESFARYAIPRTCPVCGEEVTLADENESGSYVAVCKNPGCPAKMLGGFVHFVSRDCMNIIGLSEAIIERLVDKGFIREYADFWKLDRYKEEIVSMDGFGEKSYQNWQNELKKAGNTTFIQLINALGIPNIGKGQAKLLFNAYRDKLNEGEDILSAFVADALNPKVSFAELEGFGTILDQSIHDWAKDNLESLKEEPARPFGRLMQVITVTDRMAPEKQEKKESAVKGMTFVITGEVHLFKNRAELQKKIEELGGKATGSVSKSTTYLINNDSTSQSSKNKKARELGIPILTEEAFMALIGE